MPTELEKQWMAAWRRAGPELERIRNEELCVRDDRIGMKLLGAVQPQLGSAQSGLVTFQAWMMRLLVKQLMSKE
ncbi:MAG: hypothetical protein NTX48_18615 [Planctomycetales bacterium]|nr:hypothetical protein [Planctomycetales bacterium]